MESLYNVAEIQLTYKNNIPPAKQCVIRCSEDAYKILLQNWDDNRLDFVEDSKLLLLNRTNIVLGIVNLSSGGLNSTVVDPKLIFAAALKANSSSIILAHNHPSGLVQPSHNDKALTHQIYSVGQSLTLPLLDHIIVGRDCYFSFGDECVLSC